MADTRIRRVARERYRDLVHAVAADVRRLRLDRGLSQHAVADAAGIDPSMVSRIESGQRIPTLEALTAIVTALGAEPSIRFYPTAGPRVFDRTQARIVEALLDITDPRWAPRLEVAVYRPARGVIDLVLAGDTGDIVPTEVQGELRRVEQLIRRSGEKADSLPSAIGWPWDTPAPRVHRLLVVRSTQTTRATVRSLPQLFATAFPASASDAYEALTSPAAPWPGSALLWADVDAGRTRILRGTPHGLGR